MESVIPDGFWLEYVGECNVLGIGYWRVMGFSVKMPANQVRSLKKSWDFRGYGLSEVWFMGVLTVYQNHLYVSKLRACYHALHFAT